MCREALLRQNIGWYDFVQDRSFLSQISDLAVALYYCWLPTFVIVPAFLVVSALISTFQSRMAVQEQRAYAKSGNMAQEVLANIKTVRVFGGPNCSNSLQ
ncbi:unnamed protein product [Allacma fusca]|uniref:ABC transmembrane type-1 domain-containing protein n=1 Tax=Allacma fusca TaxID=39272 RepID=A0A8J2NVN3_9HEXA|nr:unnamed protein product [Allacma fusca]